MPTEEGIITLGWRGQSALGSGCSVSQSCPIFVTPWTAARQASVSLTISRSLTKFMSIASVMSSCNLILWHTLLLLSSNFPCPQSFPASGTFPISQLFASDDQNTRISGSASVIPASIQGWFSLRLTGWISVLSKELSGVFSSTPVWRHGVFGTLPSLWSGSHNHTWPLGRP